MGRYSRKNWVQMEAAVRFCIGLSFVQSIPDLPSSGGWGESQTRPEKWASGSQNGRGAVLEEVGGTFFCRWLEI